MGARGTSPVAPGAGTAGLGGALPALPGCNRYLRNNHHRVFLGLEVVFFYPFASGFSVAASYCFSASVWLFFRVFFFLRFLSAIIKGLGHLEQALSIPWAGEIHLFLWWVLVEAAPPPTQAACPQPAATTASLNPAQPRDMETGYSEPLSPPFWVVC